MELLVSIAIFAMMTVLLLAKYGNFNQGVLLNNLAYDVALTIRNAQSYGLNVKSSSQRGATTDNFSSPFGVHFVAQTTNFVFYADLIPDGVFVLTDDYVIATTTIKRGSQVGALCLGTAANSCTAVSTLDVTFKRPDPNALFKAKDSSGVDVTGNYAEVKLVAIDGTIKKVVIRSTGQIAVTN